MDFLNTIMRGRLKSLFSKDFARWKTTFENLVMLHDPDLWIFITEPYEKPTIAEYEFFPDIPTSVKTVNQMSDLERKNFDLEKKTYETILACLPNYVSSGYRTMKIIDTSFRLWDSLIKSNTKLRDTSSDEGMKEDLMKKENEFKVLQTQLLNMENERKELRLKVARMEERILEFESQQTVLTRLQEDHELALKTIQDLRERLSESEKDVKKVYERKSSCEKNNSSNGKNNSSCEKKKFSQFTTYSLQKNKKCLKCSGKIQSTKSSNYSKVDCCDNSGYLKCNNSSALTSPKKSRDFKLTLQPESRRTKPYAYTREQMFSFAPPRFHHMVQNRRKDFVPFSWRTSVWHNQFRNETKCLHFRWNSMSLDFIDQSYRTVSKLSKQIGTVLKWVPKVKI